MSQSAIIDRDADRRRVILDAAFACFLQFGYAKTSLDDIAKRAGISRPLLYRKFANKEAIYGAVYDEVHESRYPRARAVMAARGSKRGKLVKVYDILVIEPWEIMWDAPMVEEFYDACIRVIPEIHAKHEKRLFDMTKQLLGKADVAEVFLLALEGLFSDLPTVAVLRKRLGVLIDRFAP